MLGVGGVASAQAPQNALKPICSWGPNPTNLELKVYVPSKLPPKPAVILAIHYCGGTGPAYANLTEYSSLADSKGFVVLYPTTNNDNHCWDVASTRSLTRNGGGDSTGLAHMVRWAIRKYRADPRRVFLTGISSGCLMSNVMAATYPDLFAAASCYSGAAAGCLAGSPGSSPATADPACGAGRIVKTPAEWAAVAGDMYPGYTGAYPRFQTWHGEADDFVSYPNLAEQLKQWSALLSVSFSHNVTDTPEPGYTKMVYGDGTKLVGYSARGVGHVVPAHETSDLEWFGL
ncbi:hypothetical protein N0V88_006231 [Collariella sp. IMI 366227]|nr:hypothetical protein N0V88_006231 [Collariella sp. IMI 366227]